MPVPKCFKVAARGATGALFNRLSRIEIERCEPSGDEVAIEILHCEVWPLGPQLAAF